MLRAKFDMNGEKIEREIWGGRKPGQTKCGLMIVTQFTNMSSIGARNQISTNEPKMAAVGSRKGLTVNLTRSLF